MKPQVILVTPEIAHQFLQHNVDNRAKRGWWSTSLASAIKRGEWITSHQGVAFDCTGKLIDGQHRLQAVIEANTAVNMLVVTDVPNDAYKIIDCGIKRTLADSTGINVRTTEVCRLLGRIGFGGSVITADQCLAVYNTGAGEIHDNLVEFCSKQVKVFSSAPIRTAAVCMILDGYNQQYIKNLYSNICHQQFNELPNIAQSFIRQVMDKKVIANNQSDLIARALKIFNPEFKDTVRLQISDSETTAAMAYCRDIIKKLLIKERK
jgi:hypothetical protein